MPVFVVLQAALTFSSLSTVSCTSLYFKCSNTKMARTTCIKYVLMLADNAWRTSKLLIRVRARLTLIES